MSGHETVVVDDAFQLDYDLRTRIARECGGWIRESGGPEGDVAKVWHADKEYVFSGRGLVEFLYAVKDTSNGHVYAALKLCDYIEKAADQAPSVFVRDAIVARASRLKAQINDGAES